MRLFWWRVSRRETVRDLNIFFPAGKDWDPGRIRMKCRNENWGWKEDVPDFYGRISTIFPNVKYHAVEAGKAAVRMARLEKFKECRNEGWICTGFCGFLIQPPAILKL